MLQVQFSAPWDAVGPEGGCVWPVPGGADPGSPSCVHSLGYAHLFIFSHFPKFLGALSFYSLQFALRAPASLLTPPYSSCFFFFFGA